MKTRDLLKEKENCYATNKVDKCNDSCRFYWTCKSYQRSLEIGDIKNREDILNKECH